VIEIVEADANLLLTALREGRVALFLGAGASVTSQNSARRPVAMAATLAEKLATQSGLKYAGDTLGEVLGAVLGSRLSLEQFHKILEAEYTRVTPSPELSQLFDFTWHRVYTWNVDDSIEHVKGGVQRRRPFNAMIDKVRPHEGTEYLQTIWLHGQATKPEHGFIFSQADYSERLNNDRHDWYREAANDYVAAVPVFIGSRLNEPILAAELERARPRNNVGFGLAYLVTPDNFSEIQLNDFRSRNIVIVQATLADFVSWIKRKIGAKMTPIDVGRRVSAFVDNLASRIQVSRSDVDVGQSIRIRSWTLAKADADQLKGSTHAITARAFLEGMPPTWPIAASDIPAWLKSTDALYQALMEAITRRDRMFLVFGQSGSGKTMALMQALVKYSREQQCIFYEIDEDVPSLQDSLDLIRRLHIDEHVVVYIGDAFIYSDALAEDATRFPSGSMTLVTSARSGEWRDHIQRRVGDFCSSFQYQRFERADFSQIIEKLSKYVPAPRFKRMSQTEKIAKLQASNSQLLIALREATESAKFTEVITNEFLDLPDSDCRRLALIVGMPTIARTGISVTSAREAYDHLKQVRPFEDALRALEGIVALNAAGRLTGRHTDYVRHIVEHVASIDDVITSIIEILRTFTKYEIPITKNVGRQDSLLFRFLLNHNFISSLARNRSGTGDPVQIYKEFEIDFQLDGHYWLQYGQFLVQKGDLEPALELLNKSIQAYPGNPYAWHAYADLQLQVAERRDRFDARTVELLDEAVKVLEAQHAVSSSQSDQYPIVTLSDRYVGALIKHNQTERAKEVARKYFIAIDDLARRSSADSVLRARERLAMFIATGVWNFRPPAQKKLSSRKRKMA
jgi:tetratricopeptide (TPR) repeat protein